jgi:hypothetical protein
MRYLIFILFSINYLFSCVTLSTPTSNINEGFTYQGHADSFNACQLSASENSDGLGFSFFNPNADEVECPAGYCYFNTSDTSGGSETPPTTDDKYDVQQLIPYIDEIESKNQEVVNELQNLDSNLSNSFTTLDENFENINNTLTKIDEKLENEETENQELEDIADNHLMDLNIDNDLLALENDYESSLSNAFSNYSNVFGIGGYGSAPSSISFNLLSKTYTVFDISYISAYVEHIRNIFLVSAYLFGIFLVFKGN